MSVTTDRLMGFVRVSDLDVAQRFHGDVLGLELRDERPFALVVGVGGTTLRIAGVDELAGRGVRFTRYDGMGQDERGIWTAPGGGRIAWFLDPDRNNSSLAELPR